MYPDWIKSNHLRYSIKKCVLKILQNSQESCKPQACNFIKKETLAQVISWEFCEISKNNFLQNTSKRLLPWLNTISKRKQNSPYSLDVCAVLILVIHGFTKRSSAVFVPYNLLFCCFYFSRNFNSFFLILLVFNPIVLQTYISKVIDPCNLPLHQVVLSFY